MHVATLITFIPLWYERGIREQGDTTFTSQVTGYLVYAIEKAIWPPFANQVTY